MNVILRALFLCLFLILPLTAQINLYLKNVRPPTVAERRPFSLSVELQQSSELSRVTVYYRQFGQSEYRAQEMQIMRDSAVTEIPGTDVTAPFIEFYIVANSQSGNIESYPTDNPNVSPSRITVEPESLTPPSEVIILSPDDGEQVKEGETYISLSFVYADTSIDRSKTKIALNGVDLSGSMVLYDDLLIIPPDAIPASAFNGTTSLSIQTYDANGKELSSTQRGFTVLTTQEAEEIESEFQGNGNAQAETRSENIKGTSKTYNRLDARGYGTYAKFLRANAQLTLTSEERSTNQPQNRYYLGLDARYVKLGLGDAYPKFPFTIMDGRRVRGVTFDVLLGGFNLNVADGELLRRVEYNGAPSTLKRNMLIVRPSFGKGEQFQWGFTFMKAKDQFEPGKTGTVKPQENAVFGTDLLWAFDDRKIEWTTQAAVSLNNVDISSAEFNKDSIDAAVAKGTFSSSDGSQLKQFLPVLKLFITPNENLVPVNPVGGTSLVYETGLSFYYFGNFLKASYLFHGKDYTSASATSLRRDIKGFNIMDRLRLLDNRLFLTGSFERLSNNTASSEITTTDYTTINTAVSYYPSTNLPNITVGLGVNTNINPISSDTTGLFDDPVDMQIALRALNDRTNRYFLQTSYDFSYWGRHNASLNIDISNKKDNTFKKQDISTFNLILLGSTVHSVKLESTVGLAFSTMEYPQVDTNNVRSQAVLSYQTVTLSARYKLYEEILRLTGTFAPTFGDLSRTLFETGLQYSITQYQTASLQVQFIANSSAMITSTAASRNDSFVSLQYRIDF
ncbi:MAG: hypothetical protein ACOYNS_04225 [Bacteroidota bacterium]